MIKPMMNRIIAFFLALFVSIQPVYALDGKKDWSNDPSFHPFLYSQEDNQLIINFEFKNVNPVSGDQASINLPVEYMEFKDTTEEYIYAYQKDSNESTDEVLGKVKIDNGEAIITFIDSDLDYIDYKGQFTVEGSFRNQNNASSSVIWYMNDLTTEELELPQNNNEDHSSEQTGPENNGKAESEDSEIIEDENSQNEELDSSVNNKEDESSDLSNETSNSSVTNVDNQEEDSQEIEKDEAENSNTNGNNEKEDSINLLADEASVKYQTHVQTYGWQSTVSDGATSGTSGQAKRLEGIKINLGDTGYSGGIQYRTHVQTYGWQGWKQNGELSGTTGQAKRLEAIQIKLTGELANHYDIYYRTHVQKFGWLGWAKNGESSGTSSYTYRMEAIQIVLVKKGGVAPGDTSNTYKTQLVTYQTHVQTYGWQSTVSDGATSGTSGQAKRLEGIKINLGDTGYSGGIQYRTHVQTYGWQDWKQNGTVSGTSGQAKRLEAIQIKLTGDVANYYDVYYRVHVQTYGWLGWVKNGDKAGTEGMAKRTEAIQIQIRKKGDTSIKTSNGYLGTDRIGSLKYSVNSSSYGWQSEKTNGATAGTTGQSKAINGIKISIDNNSGNLYSGTVNYKVNFSHSGWTDIYSSGQEVTSTNPMLAIQVSLTGEMNKYCDIYYRTHLAHLGWLGWAMNGQSAGNSSKSGNQVEAIEIKIVPKGTVVGSNSGYYREYASDLEQTANEINNSLGRDLRAAFNYSKSITYSRYEPADNNAYGSANYASYGFSRHRGNCYVMAAVFTYLARDLGYDAHQMGGYQGSYNTPHSWVEINMNGTIYVFDPDFEKELGRNGYMFTYGTSGTLKYHSYSRMN